MSAEKLPELAHNILSPAEQEVMNLLVQGLSAKEIARIRGVSVQVVKHHLSGNPTNRTIGIYGKIQELTGRRPNEVEAVTFALRNGWASLWPSKK